MKLHRFLYSWPAKSSEEKENYHLFKIEETELINQIKKVLKLKVGEFVLIFDGQGREAKSQLKEIGKDFVELEILEERLKTEKGNRVRLCQALLKKENFELVVQKVTEAGVAEIIPIVTERTVKLGLKEERLKKIAIEASEQSGRVSLPILSPTLNLKEAIEKFCQAGKCLAFDGEGGELGGNFEELTIFVGPEGGWSEGEKALFQSFGVKFVSLGSLTLRAETAAIIATFITVNSLNSAL